MKHAVSYMIARVCGTPKSHLFADSFKKRLGVEVTSILHLLLYSVFSRFFVTIPLQLKYQNKGGHMAKSKKKGKPSFLSLAGFLSFLLGAAACLFGFAPFVMVKGSVTGGNYGYITGFQEAFGAHQKTGNSNPEWALFADESTFSEWAASPKTGLLIAMILGIVGAVLVLLSVLFKKKNVALGALLLSGAMLLAAGIMFFFPIQFGSYSSDIMKCSLGWGALVSGILGILAGVTAIGAVVYQKL